MDKNFKVVDKRVNKEVDRVYYGDIVLLKEEKWYYKAYNLNGKMAFVNLETNCFWNSNGLEISKDFELNSYANRTDVLSHFHGDDIEIIKKENYKLTLELLGDK